MIENQNKCKQMTLEDKAKLVNGATFFGMAGIERLQIPRLQLLDGGTGMNFEQLFGDMVDVADIAVDSTNGMVGSTLLMHVIEYYFEPEHLSEEEYKLYEWIHKTLLEKTKGEEYAPGCFPPGILLGATWNQEIVRRVGEALGKEARLFGVDILLGSPNVNIHRDPLNGRLFEGYSEDPCVVSKLAPELVKGVQKYGVAANVKHFAANNQETNRVGINETISKRALEEIYLQGFKACVIEGGVKTVMSAYNRINGVPCTESYDLLTKKLRNEWGFEGAVLSDWGAVYHDAKALAAGNDLKMPGPSDWNVIANAVREGELSEKLLDKAVIRLLDVISFVENAKPFQENLKSLEAFTNKAAYDAALEGIVLLRNDGIFPLQKGQKVAIVGSGAAKLMECGTGSAGITTNRTTSLYKCLCKELSRENVCLNEIKEDTEIILCVCKVSGMEGNDRPDLLLLEKDRELLNKIKNEYSDKQIALLLNTCGPVDLSEYGSEVVKGIFAMFLPGMEGGHAMADLLLGKENPSGKLPITFPLHYEDTPTFLNFPGDGYEVNYGEGIYVGYRYYDKKKVKPLFPFGFGLSYTNFAYSDVTGNEERVEVSITNTGDMKGSQVIQLYISDPFSTLPKPVKELKNFKKVALESRESKKVVFSLQREKFSSYDTDLEAWTVEEGYYDIILATSSAAEDEIGRIRIYLAGKSPYSYGRTSTIKTLYENEELRRILKDLWLGNNWDWGIVESNYQYTPNKRLEEIVPEVPKSGFTEFEEKVSQVIKY